VRSSALFFELVQVYEVHLLDLTPQPFMVIWVSL
jgi:hypothetical protein